MEDRPNDRPGRAATARPEGAGGLRRARRPLVRLGAGARRRLRSDRAIASSMWAAAVAFSCGGRSRRGARRWGSTTAADMVELARSTSGARSWKGVPRSCRSPTVSSLRSRAWSRSSSWTIRSASCASSGGCSSPGAGGSRSSRRRPRRRARLPLRTRSRRAGTSTPTLSSRRCHSPPGSPSRT